MSALEFQDPAVIKAYQEAGLHKLVRYVSKKSPFYKRMFQQYGINPTSIQTLKDLTTLPVTTKEDLQRYNDDFLCVPAHQIRDYVCTSGTLGKPVTIALTDTDLKRLAHNEFLSLGATGGGRGEVYQMTTTMDKRFMAGLAYFLGAQKLKAGMIRTGSGVPEMQWDTIERLKPTALIGVPSFFLKLIEYAEEQGIDYRNSSVRKLICVGENIRNLDFSLNALGQRIADQWDIPLFSTYASTEMGASFTECAHGQGGHLHPELLIVEFLDEYNQPVSPGEPGELTITTLGVQGMPLLRFKTGDICISHTEKCACGRQSLRLSPVVGRKKQMIKYKGTTLFPQAIYEVLHQLPYVKNYLVELHTGVYGTDEVLIRVGGESLTAFHQTQVKDRMKAHLRVTPSIVLHSNEEIHRLQFPASARKPIILVDNR